MNKSIRMLFYVWIFVVTVFSSCSEDEKADLYSAGFSYQIDTSNPNKINFTNTSQGDYLYVQWDFGKGEGVGTKETDKTTVRSIHYPQKGSYEVTLTVWGPQIKAAIQKQLLKP